MLVCPRLEVITVSTDKQYFQPMSMLELTTRNKMGDLNLCDNVNIQVRQGVVGCKSGQLKTQLCTWFLYKSRFDHIKMASSFHI